MRQSSTDLHSACAHASVPDPASSLSRLRSRAATDSGVRVRAGSRRDDEPQDAQPEPPPFPCSESRLRRTLRYHVHRGLGRGDIFLEDHNPERVCFTYASCDTMLFYSHPFRWRAFFPRKPQTERPSSSRRQDACLHEAYTLPASGDGSFAFPLLHPLLAGHLISSHLVPAASLRLSENHSC